MTSDSPFFTGPIPEAIQQCTAQNKLLFVTVQKDEEEMSSRLDSETWADSEVCTALGGSDVVSLRLIANTEACQQFTAYFPVLVFPTMYFLQGMNPLLIQAGFLSPPDFLAKLAEAQAKRAGTAPAAPAGNTDAVPAAAPATAAAVGAMPAEGSIEAPSQAASPGRTQSDIKRRAAELQQKAQEIQRKKAADAETDELEAERRRRADGQAVHEMKEQRERDARKRDLAERKREEQADKEYKKKLQTKLQAEKEARAAERKKEREEAGLPSSAPPKEEPAEKPPKSKQAEAKAALQAQKASDAAAKKQVTDRIAADRARRKAESQGEQLSSEPATTEGSPQRPVKRATSSADATKIALKLPDGSILKHSFPAGNLLSACTPIIEEALGNVPFCLANTYPRKVYQPADLSRSFADLDLVPNAMLEVQLGAGGGSPGEGIVGLSDDGLGAQVIALLFWLLALLNPMRWLSAGTGPEAHRREEAANDPHDAGSSHGSRNQPTQPSRRGPGGAPMAGGGRHVTLAQLGRDDDDSETNERYNGDSTNLM